VQICLRDVNVAIDLPGLPQIPAPATDQSCAATSSANTLIGAGCPRPAPWCANLHSARRSPPHRLPFPAGSFIEGFRTPATVQAASLPSAGIRNPQQLRTFSVPVRMSQMCQTATSNVQVAPKGKAARRRLSGFVDRAILSGFARRRGLVRWGAEARRSTRLDVDCLGGLNGLGRLFYREMQHTFVEMSFDGSGFRLER